MQWFEIDNWKDLTPELLKQRQRDYRLMFYGSKQNQAIFAEIIRDVESTTDDGSRNILRDFVKTIKAACGVNDYRKIIQAESESLKGIG